MLTTTPVPFFTAARETHLSIRGNEKFTLNPIPVEASATSPAAAAAATTTARTTGTPGGGYVPVEEVAIAVLFPIRTHPEFLPLVGPLFRYVPGHGVQSAFTFVLARSSSSCLSKSVNK